MLQINDKIKEIKCFLKNCSKEESDLEHIRPIYKRQMICKDLGISELLFELLYYMRKNFEGKYKKTEVAKDENGDKAEKKIVTDPYIFDQPEKADSL